ncbi:hypothetical protein BLNAU_8632 [Blattamonas nauphoetae]|uniref:TPX2 C-terminal domain-containing protein n=1 Tax=Blattamonas nauphoetae TaxID=2049346 RepID=A0ABQ9XY69_9EUKA|nr:hypothetical protein BLNAU_8632 [Blattamonas nauphoetae]
MEVDELDSLRNRPHDSQEVVGDTSTSVNAESESHTDPNVTPPTLFANNSPQRSALHTPPHSPQSHQRTTRNQEFSHIGFISPAFVAKTRSSIQSHNFPNETHSNHSAIDLPHRTPKILQEGHSLHDFPVKTDTKSSLTPNSLKQKPIRTRNAPGLHVDVDPESTDDIPVPSTLPPTATAHSVPPQYAPRIQSPKNSDNVELNDDDDELDSLDLETLEVSKMIGKIHESLKDLSKHASQNLSDSLRQLETDTSSSPRPASQYTPNLQNSQTPNMNMVDVNQSKPLLSSNTSKKTLRTPPPHRKEEITPKSSKTPSRIPKLSKRAGNDKSEKFTASNVVVFKLNDDEVGPDKPLETPQRIVKIPKINEKAQKSSTNLVNDSGTSPRISVDTPTKTGRPPLSPSDPKHISPHPTKPTPFVPRTPPSTYRELFRQTKELRQKVEETTNPPFLRTVVLTRLTDDEKRELAKFEEEKRMEEEKRIEEETARRLAEEERRKSNTKTAGTPQRHSVAKRQPARQTQSISPSIKRH